MKMYKDREKDMKVTLEEALTEVDKFPIVEGSFLGFFNERNETIQFIRFRQDQWLIDVPVLKGGKYVYSLQDEVKHSQVKEIVTRFFQGKDWKSLCNLRKP